MNKTREKIIELIEPYMNKTLSEECLIDFPNGIRVVSYVEEIGVKYFGEDGEIYGVEHRHFSILGHYDITAVLKYIESRTIISNFCVGANTFTFTLWEKMSPGDLLYGDTVIPNKPLNLYTEQEEKDLLELLLKLKN